MKNGTVLALAVVSIMSGGLTGNVMAGGSNIGSEAAAREVTQEASLVTETSNSNSLAYNNADYQALRSGLK